MVRLCKVSDCNGPHKGHGYCDKHYQRFKRRGTVEGFARRERHGMGDTPEYEAWCHMKGRCYNPQTKQYKDYGGRGIRVCDEWRESFLAFLDHVGRRPNPQYSIHRIDNDGNYEPGNVKWATRQEQASNKRPPRHGFRRVRNETGLKGVYPYRGRWVAKLWYKKKLLHLGTYDSPLEASEAYQEALKALY